MLDAEESEETSQEEGESEKQTKVEEKSPRKSKKSPYWKIKIVEGLWSRALPLKILLTIVLFWKSIKAMIFNVFKT